MCIEGVYTYIPLNLNLWYTLTLPVKCQQMIGPGADKINLCLLVLSTRFSDVFDWYDRRGCTRRGLQTLNVTIQIRHSCVLSWSTTDSRSTALLVWGNDGTLTATTSMWSCDVTYLVFVASAVVFSWRARRHELYVIINPIREEFRRNATHRSTDNALTASYLLGQGHLCAKPPTRSQLH